MEIFQTQVQMSLLTLVVMCAIMYIGGVLMEKFLQSRKRKLTREDFAKEMLAGAHRQLEDTIKAVEARRKQPVDL